MRDVSFVVALICCWLSGTAAATDFSGVWLVRAPATWPEWIRDWVGEDYGISFVKDGAKHCAVLSWIHDVSNGLPADKDEQNTNPALQNRGLLGLTIATGLTEQSGNFTTGRFYFPRSGKYHSIRINFDRPDGATVESADVVLRYGWCPICWEFKQITLERRRPAQLAPPIKDAGPCHFQE